MPVSAYRTVAIKDLQPLQEYYTEQQVPHIGDEYVAAILEHCEMLQIYPDAGRVVPEFNLGHIRELIHALFWVVYLIQAKEVVLIRVWRSERELELPKKYHKQHADRMPEPRSIKRHPKRRLMTL